MTDRPVPAAAAAPSDTDDSVLRGRVGTRVLQIDFVSDVACPWCAVGLGALLQAAERLAGEVELDIAFQPFELNPQMPAEGEDVDAHLQRKYGRTPEEFAAAREQIRARGAEVGFAFGTRSRIWPTFDAHRLLHWAGLEGASTQRRLKQALLQAYHGEGRNPSDPEVLAACAAEAGLDEARAREIVGSDEYAHEVREHEQMWLDAGIRAVPAVVIDRRHLISGAQPAEAYADALRDIALAPR